MFLCLAYNHEDIYVDKVVALSASWSDYSHMTGVDDSSWSHYYYTDIPVASSGIYINDTYSFSVSDARRFMHIQPLVYPGQFIPTCLKPLSYLQHVEIFPKVLEQEVHTLLAIP